MLNWIVVVLALLAFGAEAQAGPVGPQFQLNTYKPGRQDRTAIAALTGGGFVVTWESEGQDGYIFGVYGQRYNALGQPLGGEFRVNTQWQSQQFGSSVAGLADGGFVVTWYSQYSGGAGPGVYGQRYTAAGIRVGANFHAGASPAGFHLTSSVASLADGGFVVLWQYGDSEIAARRFSAGIPRPVGQRIKVGSSPQDPVAYSNPKVAGLATGGFVVVWLSENFSGSTVFARRYTASAAATGDAIKVAFGSSGGHPLTDPNVAVLKDGSFVVTWGNRHALPTNNPHVYAQRFTSTGAKTGTAVHVNTTGGCYQSVSAPLADGGFVVSYTVRSSPSLEGIYGQRYDKLGRRVGSEFFIRPLFLNYDPAISGLKTGGFIVTWTAPEYDFFEDDDGVFGQRFAP